MTLMWVEHDMVAVMRISDRIVVINFGCKIAEGAPAPKFRRTRSWRSKPSQWSKETIVSCGQCSRSPTSSSPDHSSRLKACQSSSTRVTVALIGANGARESSILRAITGLRKIPQGRDHFRGSPDRRPWSRGDRQTWHRDGPGRPPRVSLHERARQHLMMGAFSRSDAAGVRASLNSVLDRSPRLKERLTQTAGHERRRAECS